MKISQIALLQELMAERKTMGDNNPVIRLHFNTNTATLVTDEQVSITTSLKTGRPIKELITIISDLFISPDATLGEVVIQDRNTITEIQTLLSQIIK